MLSMLLTYNDSPLAGNDGSKNTINQIMSRLEQESEDDVSLRVNKQSSDLVKISGRGDLHLGVLLEKMRREGFELSVSPPEVLLQETDEGTLEPVEIMSLEIDQKYVADLIEIMNNRKGILLDTEDTPEGKILIRFDVPSRGLIGFRN